MSTLLRRQYLVTEENVAKLNSLSAEEGVSATEIVRRAIHRLPAASRKVVTLRYRDRLKFSEIAVKLGRSPDAVRMLWYRAIDRLASELELYHE